MSYIKHALPKTQIMASKDGAVMPNDIVPAK